ncbi:uncharacterized protein PAC_16148 [Phialocephala subalpina]|uniref:2EXR domain-containing protein n=1 Tax=Phialocephala subalpina TaxID=576137 RepID=A0A1L7XMT3_9HELO|nr:uncharacterized protein PAC_16148 [Phialocephala subalpina]
METINESSVESGSASPRVGDINGATDQNIDNKPGDGLRQNIPLKEFTLFHKLPIELRQNILYDEEHALDMLFEGTGDVATKLTTITARTAPAVLHASQESREVALRYYSLDSVYVNWKSDVLCPTTTFELVDYRGEGNARGTGLTELRFNTKLRRIAVTLDQLHSVKSSLPNLALDEVIAYIAPGLGAREEAQAEANMEGCSCCRYINTNSRFAITFNEPHKYLKNTPAVSAERSEEVKEGMEVTPAERAEEDEEVDEDEEEEDDYGDWEAFVPHIRKPEVKSAKKKIKTVVDELSKKAGKKGWKLPEFNVKVMEIHDKDI